MKDLRWAWKPAAGDIPRATLPQQQPHKNRKKRKKGRRARDGFYTSGPWLRLRYEALKLHGAKCQCCCSTDGPMHVDHVKPRCQYPDLELRLSNLQVLCEACNLGKGGWDDTDWRPTAEQREHLRAIKAGA